MKKGKKRISILRMLRNILGVLFILSMLLLATVGLDYNRMQKHNEQIKDMVFVTDTENVPKLQEIKVDERIVSLPVIDFDKLKAINEQCAGWIYACDGKISYPIAASQDEYYLHHAIDGKESKAGAIFADTDLKNPFADQRTIIYGHNMKDGSMFQPLLQYWQEDDYKKEHPYIYIIMEETIYTYEVTNVYVKEYAEIVFSTDTDISKPKMIDLVTCEYSGEDTRLVVEAVQIASCKIDVFLYN